MSEAKMRKIRRIKASVKHARKIRRGHKQKVPARKKKSQSVVAKTHINLNQPGALTRESVARLIASASDKTRTQLQVTKFGVVSISSERIGGGVDEDLARRRRFSRAFVTILCIKRKRPHSLSIIPMPTENFPRD